ncbi:ETX/MTX2 family pore-forming toxin [Mucilaginibacter sp. KACC 22063]|uniref:ETX/MTX2 family pore-forming toxin n=1 Tax=Mucilaginibacter sp. KACC 22063 TaxID=3025666 RepID=UPI0023661C4B|nr:ETX/MTX2 family pore-forming toxin [Mucilaginibacter sp. KACC 22063]WDF54366.1 ETX/MTX2 family pore-forming toxin [Mucilaginibacter sp. KACC 22063]
MKKFIYLSLITLSIMSCKKDVQLQKTDLSNKGDLKSNAKLASLSMIGDSIVPLDSTKFPKKPKKLKAMSTSDVFNDLYQLNGINFFIQTKDAYFSKNTLQSQGKGKEVILAPYSSTNGNQLFHLRFLPASTGIPYLIYSANEEMPIGAGSYASNPNKYVLYTQAAGSTSLFGFSWDFAANATNDAYYFINQDILGSGGSSPWDVFNYYLDATNGAIGFARPSNGIAQQFNIVPNDIFKLESIEYINDATATLSQIPDFSTTWTYTNGTSVQQSITTSFGQKASKTSNFTNQSTFTTKVSTEIKASVPFIASGKISTEIGGSISHTYGQSETSEDTRNYDIPLLIPANTRVTATATVTRYNMNVNYIATLRGQNTSKVIKVRGVWSGVDCTDIVVNTQQTNLKTLAVSKGVSIKVTNK